MRRLRGIGPGIEARLRELVETGEIAELDRARARARARAGRPRPLPRARRAALGRDRPGARRPHARRVPRGGGGRPAADRAGHRAEDRGAAARRARARGPRPQHGLLLNRARELVGGVAAALGGTPAGDVRRWRDSASGWRWSASSRPGLRGRFAELPQIVAVIEQDERRAVGVTVEGVPDRASSPPSRSASGPRWCAPPARPPTSPRSSRCPDAPDEDAVYRALGIPWCPPELREQPFRGEPPPLVEAGRHPRRPALPHDVVGRPRERRGDGPRRARARLRVRRDLRPHARRRRRPRPHARRRPPPGARRSRPPTSCWRRSASCAGSSATSCPTAGSTSPTTCSRSSTGCRRASTAASGCRAREMTKRVEEALRNPHVRCLSHPTGRIINRRPENALDLERVFEVALEHGVALEVNGLAAPPRPQRRARPRRAARRACRSSAPPTRTPCTGSATWSSRCIRHAAAGRRPIRS